MSILPPDTRAFRQMIYVGVLSFGVGFVAVLAVMGWLIARFVAPDGRWWDILHVSINTILISVFGGLCFAAATTAVLSRVQYLRGVYRCPHCGRQLKGAGVPCDCQRRRDYLAMTIDVAEYRGWFIPNDVTDLRRFLCAGYMHNSFYLGGVLAIPVAWAFHIVVRIRRTMQADQTVGHFRKPLRVAGRFWRRLLGLSVRPRRESQP